MSINVYLLIIGLSIGRSLDWRTRGILTPIKNQGSCGSCWAFATISLIESQLAINYEHHPPYQLSEQQLVDCTVGNSGCGGGIISRALSYAQHGLCTNQYQYMAQTGQCRACDPIVNVTSIYNFYGEQDMIRFLQKGPITAYIDATQLHNYHSGIISNQHVCTIYPNHAVSIVGYDYNNITNTRYWIVRNSWGPQWGEYGYFRIVRGINKCGIEYGSFMVDIIPTKFFPPSSSSSAFRQNPLF